MKPRISVITSVHNGAATLEAAITSVLQQTYADFEFIIVDDASTDSSLALLHNQQDARINIIQNEKNQGLTASLNRALEAAQGELVARQDADDISLPTRFERQVEFLKANQEVGVLGTQMHILGAEGKQEGVYSVPTAHSQIVWNLFFDRSFAHPTVMMRANILKAVNGYDDSFAVSQDHNLWARLVGRTRFANLDEALVDYHSTGSEVSSRRADEQYANRMRTRANLASRLMGREVPLKMIMWLDASQTVGTELGAEQRRQALGLLHDLFNSLAQPGVMSAEEREEIRDDFLECSLRVGASSAGQEASVAEELASKIIWGLSNPAKTIKKIFASDDIASEQVSNSSPILVPGSQSREGLSVIVLSYDRPHGLRSLLRSLGRQDTQNFPVEVIVFNNSTHSLKLNPDLNSEMAGFPNLKLIESSFNWRTPARYAMATLASNETVLFLDDDLILEDDFFLHDMKMQFIKLRDFDILSCWNELWVEWDDSTLYTVSLDFNNSAIKEIIPTDTIGPGISMFRRELLLNPKIMDIAMQRNQASPIVSDMAFPLIAAIERGSQSYYFPAYGRLSFDEEFGKSAIHKIPGRREDLLSVYKELYAGGYKPVKSRVMDLSDMDAQRVEWAVETLPTKQYAW